MLTDDKVIFVHSADDVLQRLCSGRANVRLARRRVVVWPVRSLAAGSETTRLGMLLVERPHQIDPPGEKALGERARCTCFLQFGIGTEELDILAIVEDPEELL